MVITVIGGSGSGKSEFAEQKAKEFGDNIAYIATMENVSEASKAKIRRHKDLRKNKNFTVIEKQYSLYEENFESFDGVILECVSNLITNEMYFKENEHPLDEILKGIYSIKCKNIVFVTNDVFRDGVSFLEFSDIHGVVNSEICELSDEVYEVVVGIPLKIK